MADKKISQLSAASTPLAGTEVLPIVQSSATVKVATNDLTVRNVRANATTGILQVTGPAAASTRVMTVPDANFTAARTDAAQTFTGNQTFGTVLATTFDTNVAAAGVTLAGITLAADGTDTDINVNLTPKGSGKVVATTGSVSVNNVFESTAFIGINSSGATTVATGTSFLAVLRDRGSGGTALVLYDNNSSPAVVVISQTGGSKFTASAPSATQIQIANGGNAITALSGATIGATNLNVSILKNQ